MKHPAKIVIVGGGQLSKKFLAQIIKSEYIIGVDRGAYWLINNGIVPDIAIGDFDSVSVHELQIIKQKVKQVKKHPKEKDFTDTELAVNHAISLHPKEVVIYGAIGSRFDHTMANVYLLEDLSKAGIKGLVRDRNNEMMVISSRTILKRGERYRYVSVVPITESIEVTLTGFVYDASHSIIMRGQTLGISNEIRTKQAAVHVHQGIALVIQSWE